MGCTRRELLARMSSRELSEWMVYANIEPFGEREQEYRAALVTSMVANTARDPDKHPQPFSVDEFMRPSYLGQPEEREPDQETLVQKIRSVFGALAGKGS